MKDSDLRIEYRHCKQLNYCDYGIMKFLETHGIKYLDFIKRGVLVSIAEKYGDLMVNRLIDLVRKEHGGI